MKADGEMRENSLPGRVAVLMPVQYSISRACTCWEKTARKMRANGAAQPSMAVAASIRDVGCNVRISRGEDARKAGGYIASCVY